MYRYDPRRIEAGEAPLVIDAPGGKMNEARFRMAETIDPQRFRTFAKQAQLSV